MRVKRARNWIHETEWGTVEVDGESGWRRVGPGVAIPQGSRRLVAARRRLHFSGGDVRLSWWGSKRPCNFGCASPALSATEETGVAVRGAADGWVVGRRHCMQWRRAVVRYGCRYRLALFEPDKMALIHPSCNTEKGVYQWGKC